MADSHDHDELLARCRQGDDEAARILYEQHAQQLLDLARHRISQRLASRVDAEDVVQSVFRTFFKRAQAGEFTLQDQDDLCKLLARITLHKTLRQVAHHQQGKRDARQEAGPGRDDQSPLLTVLAAGPTPEEAVMFVDQLEHFLDELAPEDQKICEMRLEGYKNVEIADQLGINERRIRRLMERLRGLANVKDWLE